MKSKTNYYKVGLFVISAIFILTLFVIILGANSLFQKSVIIETYFDESIQGLDIGSMVKYRGVTVGNVKEITFTGNYYPISPSDENFYQNRYVLVRMTIKNPKFIQGDDKLEEAIHKMVTNGLRVKLTSQGLTGTSYLEVDYQNVNTNIPIAISWAPKNIYIPSTKSTISKIGATVDDFIRKLDEANLPGIAKNIDELLVNVNETLKTSNVSQLTKEGTMLLQEVRGTNKALQGILTDLNERKVGQKLDTSITLMSSSMTKLNNLLSNNNRDISIAVENFRVVTEDLREVANNAKKNPSMFLFGDAPKTSDMGKNK